MKIIKNYLFNLLYNVMSLIVPLVLTPYISRVLQVDGVGKYSISVAVSSYFVLFGMLGISTYGSRQIAYVRDEVDKLRKSFWELNIIRITTVVISLSVYVVFVYITIQENLQPLYYAHIFTIAASLFDISWFFTGIEDFKKTSIRSVIFKFLTVFSVLLFVKKKEDIVLYTLIVAIGSVLSQISMWMFLPPYLRKFEIDIKRLKIHFFGTIKLWLPALAIEIYATLDKIMLGLFTTNTQAGLYESTQKLVKMAAIIPTSFTSAALPHMANLYNNSRSGEFNRITEMSIKFISFLAIPICMGLIGISKTIVPWFFGEGYTEVSSLLFIGSFLIVTVAWSSLFGNQILVACRQENKFTKAIVINLIINVILDIILVPSFEALGAWVATIIAEYFGMFVMVYYSYKEFSISLPTAYIIKCFTVSVVMSILVYSVGIICENTMITTVIQIIIGILIYFGTMTLLNDECILYAKGKIATMLRKFRK